MAGNILTTSEMLTQGLGTASPVPMGNWNATTPYQKLNIIRYGSASYMAKKQNQGFQPTVTQGWQEVWQVLCYDGGSLSIPAMLDLFIPVGKTIPQYYGEPTPAEQFAGTSWEIDTAMQGRVAIGSGGSYTFGATGGEATHTLTVNEMPSHYHPQILMVDNTTVFGSFVSGSGTANAAPPTLNSGSSVDPLRTSSVGASQPHNIMQPYTVANYWKRTA